MTKEEGGGGIDNIFAKTATFVIEDKLLSLLSNWQFANQKHFSFLIGKSRFADDVSSVLLHQLFRLTKFLVMHFSFVKCFKINERNNSHEQGKSCWIRWIMIHALIELLTGKCLKAISNSQTLT